MDGMGKENLFHYLNSLPSFPIMALKIKWQGWIRIVQPKCLQSTKASNIIKIVFFTFSPEVSDTVQETGIKTIPKEKKCKKAKRLSEEALQIAINRREVKSKGEEERYKHLNAEFQRLARRDKKAFLSDQCKVIEENNRMGKTRDLFKKIRDTKGTFHAKMGSKKDRNVWT